MIELVNLTTNTSNPTQTKRDQRIFFMSRMGVGRSPRVRDRPWAESDWKVDWSKMTSLPLARPAHRNSFPSALGERGEVESDRR